LLIPDLLIFLLEAEGLDLTACSKILGEITPLKKVKKGNKPSKSALQFVFCKELGTFFPYVVVTWLLMKVQSEVRVTIVIAT